MDPTLSLGNTVELVLEPPVNGGGIGLTSWSGAGGLTLVAQIRESQQAGQLKCHLGPDPGL